MAKAARVAPATVTRAAKANPPKLESYDEGGETRIEPIGAIEWMAERAAEGANGTEEAATKVPLKVYVCSECKTVFRSSTPGALNAGEPP